MPIPAVPERWAILGGAFDPVHRGHVILAEQVKRLTDVDTILFVPAYKHPHKNKSSYASFECRVEMLNIAIQGIDGLIVSTIERDCDLSGYSLDTVKRLKQLHPANSFDFTIGADNLHSLAQWHRVDEFLSEVNLLICARPGFDTGGVAEELSSNSSIIQTTTPNISSTEIRSLLAKERDTEAETMLPSGVIEYIKRERLYK